MIKNVKQQVPADFDYESFLSRHDVIYKSPVEAYERKTGDNFIDGPLLGNGDVGLVVHGNPEKLIINMSKTDVWDRRLGPAGQALPDMGQITQRELLEAKDNGTLDELAADAANNYKPFRPWDTPPLPKPVGQVILNCASLDNAEFEQKLSFYDAHLESTFTTDKTKVNISTFVCAEENQVFIRYRYQGEKELNLSLDLYRWNDKADKTMTAPEVGCEGNSAWIDHRLPNDELYPDGFRYVAFAAVEGAEVQAELLPNTGRLKISGTRDCEVTICVGISTSRDSSDVPSHAKKLARQGLSEGYENVLARHKKWWHDFWSKSFVSLSDEFMENAWYAGQYLLACCSREGKVASGLYGCWITNDSSGWHGDYHLDYNFQQTYWGTYSSNHPELSHTYYDVIESLLGEARRTAKEVYNCRGAAFPVIAFPVKDGYRHTKCYPWDRIMAITAWVTQGFWWHYQYTLDTQFLKDRAYPLMCECARFYQGFLEKENGEYIICPTVSPEHHEMTKGFRLNKNCTIDLALMRFLFKAVIKASELLDVDEKDRHAWREILENLADYSTFDTPEGPIFVDVENGHPIVYNYPVPVSPVFPGEQVGMDSSPEIYDTAMRTCETIETNGNNSLITLGMAWARLGLKEKYYHFRNRLVARIQRNGSLVTHVDERWRYCSPMVEGAAVTAVVNETLLQSYDGKIRLFPALPDTLSAKFADLRTVGAFLVSAEIARGQVEYAEITSLKGSSCVIVNPWKNNENIRVQNITSNQNLEVSITGTDICFATEEGSVYLINRE